MDSKEWHQLVEQMRARLYRIRAPVTPEPVTKRQKIEPSIAPRDRVAKEVLDPLLLPVLTDLILDYLGQALAGHLVQTLSLNSTGSPQAVFVDGDMIYVLSRERRSDLWVWANGDLINLLSDEVRPDRCLTLPEDLFRPVVHRGRCYALQRHAVVVLTLPQLQQQQQLELTDGACYLDILGIHQDELYLRRFRSVEVWPLPGAGPAAEWAVKRAFTDRLCGSWICFAGDGIYTAKEGGFRVSCYDKITGLERWQQDVGGTISGMVAAGRELFLTDRDNLIKVFEPNSSSSIQEVRRFTPLASRPQVMCADLDSDSEQPRVYVYCPELNCIRIFFS